MQRRKRSKNWLQRTKKLSWNFTACVMFRCQSEQNCRATKAATLIYARQKSLSPCFSQEKHALAPVPSHQSKVIKNPTWIFRENHQTCFDMFCLSIVRGPGSYGSYGFHHLPMVEKGPKPSHPTAEGLIRPVESRSSSWKTCRGSKVSPVNLA